MEKLKYTTLYLKNSKTYREQPLGIIFISDTKKEFRHINDFSFIRNYNYEVDEEMVMKLLESIKEDISNNENFDLEKYIKYFINDFHFEKIIETNCENVFETIDKISLLLLKLTGSTMKDKTLYENIQLKEMFSILTNAIVMKKDLPKFYWKNEENEFIEIVEIDLYAGRFITTDKDFSEYEWELEKSNIYRKKKN